jgi:hypothetical protein
MHDPLMLTDNLYFAFMYSKQEASLLKKKFWTNFGQYMRPIPGADGGKVNWLNYKTGIRHIYFRMDADTNDASIAIELRHGDEDTRMHYFHQLQQLKTILEESTGEIWEWQSHQTDEDGNTVSRISRTLGGINIFREEDWPAIISFFKPRVVALDEFWVMVRDGLS